ncbi:hypothetical protein CGI77_09565 [Vibrio parahaemolyticus]|uniref:DUF6404 family protein n=1 Tax=Vibrio parahaemolyticus TaxID=670 RepID=UPI00112387B2|nr:DUF6404 family protein [Vibrio parahaemolyticus]TOH58839.1 hypothetical protein CGI77_09565 [Vibrio parahaemolyticus]
MSYERKLELAFSELETARISKWNYNPPLHQWLRKAGFKLRPPFYVPFWSNLWVRFAESFIIIFTLMSLLGSSRAETSEFHPLYESLVASSFYSVVMCLYYLWTFKRCELSHWDKL